MCIRDRRGNSTARFGLNCSNLCNQSVNPFSLSHRMGEGRGEGFSLKVQRFKNSVLPLWMLVCWMFTLLVPTPKPRPSHFSLRTSTEVHLQPQLSHHGRLDSTRALGLSRICLLYTSPS